MASEDLVPMPSAVAAVVAASPELAEGECDGDEEGGGEDDDATTARSLEVATKNIAARKTRLGGRGGSIVGAGRFYDSAPKEGLAMAATPADATILSTYYLLREGGIEFCFQRASVFIGEASVCVLYLFFVVQLRLRWHLQTKTPFLVYVAQLMTCGSVRDSTPLTFFFSFLLHPLNWPHASQIDSGLKALQTSASIADCRSPSCHDFSTIIPTPT